MSHDRWYRSIDPHASDSRASDARIQPWRPARDGIDGQPVAFLDEGARCAR